MTSLAVQKNPLDVHLYIEEDVDLKHACFDQTKLNESLEKPSLVLRVKENATAAMVKDQLFRQLGVSPNHLSLSVTHRLRQISQDADTGMISQNFYDSSYKLQDSVPIWLSMISDLDQQFWSDNFFVIETHSPKSLCVSITKCSDSKHCPPLKE